MTCIGIGNTPPRLSEHLSEPTSSGGILRFGERAGSIVEDYLGTRSVMRVASLSKKNMG